MSKHNRERRELRRRQKAELAAKGVKPTPKTPDLRHWGHHDPEAGVSHHRPSGPNRPWWHQTGEVSGPELLSL